MKTLTLSLLCTVFALSTAKPWFGKLNGRFDDMGYFHKSAEEKLGLQASTVASVQQKSGREICQSATFSHLGLTTYVHVCESGLDYQGKPASLLLCNVVICYNKLCSQCRQEKVLFR